MRNVVLFRIDDRLIHGQVVTGWLKTTSANKIYIVDDQLKNDTMMKIVLKNAAPTGTNVFIQSVDECAKALQKPAKDDEKIIILSKFPDVFEKLIDSGIQIPTIILGGMGLRDDRKKFYKNIAANDSELCCMQRIISKGTEIIYQLVPDEPSKNIKSLL
ncbi:PTS sugar transporter subunit IIB [[Clostridium] innocuum]|nr:PTS sugar transporter subunit IIB [Erysipelotrichaceae bacterium]MCR0382842.1 PTS sugar transporter subunit IIB [[Clostridium] innocuum]MCR0412138.1 PTS sugar transporter subunit IIB [[Clostridium] innocuum]MCR0535061.1 PTS sugar transporter subunit IIB [[Clostridium] innocuum]MCR0537731.1 PTS sugar transporter subunit IIB [[Clostridium] innocuum]